MTVREEQRWIPRVYWCPGCAGRVAVPGTPIDHALPLDSGARHWESTRCPECGGPVEVRNPAEPEPLWEALPCCEVQVGGRNDMGGPDECGAPAEHRFSHDGGKTWLYLCERHAMRVRRAEEEGG